MNNSCVFTVCVNDYHPEIASKTIPAMEAYAKKLDADFQVIKNRKYTDWPATYEKVQLYELGKDYDCCILLDCDVYITPDMYDVRQIVPENAVGVWMVYDPSITVKEDNYLKLDGSDTILSTNFVVTRKEQHNLWTPLDMSWEEAKVHLKRYFVVDEYCVGRNMKRFNYAVAGLCLPGACNNLFYHMNITSGDSYTLV